MKKARTTGILHRAVLVLFHGCVEGVHSLAREMEQRAAEQRKEKRSKHKAGKKPAARAPGRPEDRALRSCLHLPQRYLGAAQVDCMCQ